MEHGALLIVLLIIFIAAIFGGLITQGKTPEDIEDINKAEDKAILLLEDKI